MRKTGWDPSLLHANSWHRVKGVTARNGKYGCHECGTTWPAYVRRVWWPLSFAWSWLGSAWFRWHGFEINADGIEQRVMGQVFHLGPLKIVLGRGTPHDMSGCADCEICRSCVSPTRKEKPCKT